MELCVIICAAGASTRFGSNKLDADIAGRSVLRRTVEVFAKHDRVNHIVVAGPHNDFDAFNDRYGDTLRLIGCTLCKGGITHRWETVKSALEHAPDSATHIAVHDAARCCMPADLLDRMLEVLDSPLEDGSCRQALVPGVPMTDTLKHATESAEAAIEHDPLDAILGDAGKADTSSRIVDRTVDRADLFAVQTPQIFERELLRRAYEQDDLNSTDDAGLVERLGEPVHLVPGDPRNIKITTPADLDIARAIIGRG